MPARITTPSLFKAFPGQIIAGFGAFIGVLGNIATGSNFGTPYAYVAAALLLIGSVILIVRR